MDVFDLVAKITVDTSEYEKGLNGAETQSKSFASKLGSGLKTAAKVGAAAITAATTAGVTLGKTLVSGAQEVAEYGDNIDKMSQKIGISAQAYQEWDAVMQHSGTSVDTFKAGMKTLNKNLVDYKKTVDDCKYSHERLDELYKEGEIDLKTYQERLEWVDQEANNSLGTFGKLGLTVEDVGKMLENPDVALENVITKLQQMPEGAERAALASELLGRAGVEMGALLNTSAEETKKMRDRVHELGGVMSDEAVKASAKFQDNMQDLKTAISGIKRSIMSDTLPAFNDLIEGFTKLIACEDGAEEALDKGMEKLGQALDKILPKINNVLEKILPRLIEVGGKIVTQFVQYLPQFVSAIAKEIPGLIKTLVATITKTAPDLVKAGVELIVSLAEGLIDAIPELVAAVPDIIMALVDSLLSPEMIDRLINAGLKLIEKLFEGLISGDFLGKAGEIIQKLFSAIVGAAGKLLDAGLQLLGKIFEGIFSGDFGKKAWELIQKLGDAIVGAAMGLLGAGAKVIEKIWDGMKSAWVAVDDWISRVIYGTISGAVAEINGMSQATANAIAGGAILAEKSKGKTKTSTSSPTGGLYASSNHYINLYVGSDKVGSAVYDSNQKRAMQNGGYSR